MDCKKIKNSLFFLAEGSLKKDEEAEIRNHLKSCPACMKQFELFSTFDNILQEEKQLEPDEFFYSRLTGRMERISALPEKAAARPALLRLVNIFIITLIIGLAAFSGFTLANRNYQYLGTSQSTQQGKTQQSDIAVDQDQLSSNFSEY
jgi:predicted anti-sigma-YlaC factor YlaD